MTTESNFEERQDALVHVATDAEDVVIRLEEAMRCEDETDALALITFALESVTHVKAALEAVLAGKLPDIVRCPACGAAAKPGRTTCGSGKCGDDNAR